MNNKHYLEGVRSAQAYYKSQGFAGLSRYIKAEDAIKLFLPATPEMMMQVQTPLPPDRRNWIKGFREEQANILADMEQEKD